MSELQRGKVVMRSKAPRELENELVSLLTQITAKLSAKQVLKRVRKPPFVIREDVSAGDGEEIAAYFQAKGGDVVFIPHSDPTPPPAPAPPQPTAPKATKSENSELKLMQTPPASMVSPTTPSAVSSPKGLPPVLRRILHNHVARQTFRRIKSTQHE